MKAMKKNSGTLKLDLAQYRELAAFSQFASDLDPATRAQLERGERMMELLKQGLNAPIPVIKQVCTLFAGKNGYLDSIAVNKILKFEEDLHAALDKEKDVLAALTKDKNFSEDTEKKLITVIKKVVELNK